ncbi:unnamed protein product [Peronospora farinosa]|uniref:TRP C-terminal domain-containing protein n=1 Tax=Peronospora farinosa TaxID=134698 RepID=A0ABN8CD61_9STRA|nr:unnamed protein product [Peronospora farinosa]
MDRRRRWNSRKRALTFGLIVIIVIVVCGTSLVGADQVSNFAQLETNVRLPNLNQTTRDLRASASSIANANLDDTDKDGNLDTADAKIDDAGDDASSKSTMKKTSESTNEPTTVDDGNSNTADTKTTAIMTPETTPLASSHASNSASDLSTTTQTPQPPNTPEAVTIPNSGSTTEAPTSPTNAPLPIDLTKQIPSIETPTTSVSLESEGSTGSNKEPSTDTPAEAPTTSDDGSESSKAGSPPETPTKPDDGSESNKAGSPPETPTTPDADSATDALTKTKPPTNALLPIDLTKRLPSIETPTTSVSLDSEDSTGSNKEPSTDTLAEAPTTSDDGSESSKAGSPPETPTKPDDGSESNKAGSPPETPTTPDADSATDASTKTKSATNALLPIDLTKRLPSIETPTTSVSLKSEDSTGSNKEPSTDTPAEAPTTSDDGSESSKAGSPPETPTKPDDGSESNKAGSPPETPTTPDADSATDASTKTKPPTNALLPIDLTKKLPSIETPTTSVSLDSEGSTGSNKKPSTDTPAEAPTTSDNDSESNKAGSPPETPTTPDADSATDASTKTKSATNALLPIDLTKKLPSIETPTTSVSLESEDSTGSNEKPSTDTPAEAPTTSDDGSESNKAGSPPETPTTPDADSATDASTKTKSATNALLPIDLTKKLPSIETPTTSVSLDSEGSTGSNKEPSTDTPAEAPTTSDDGSESSKAGSPPETPTKPDDGSESNKAGSPPETPTTPDADSATDASTKTKSATNALLPIDLTKKLPSIETPTTSVSLDSEDSTGSNKEPSTDTPAEAPTTSDDGSESSKAGSPPETPTTPDADSATDASTKTKPATNALLPIDLTKRLPSIETPTTSVSLDSEDSTGSNKEPSTDTLAEAPTTSDDGSESSKAGSPPETPTKPDDGSESNKAGSPPETPTTPDADSATDASTKTKPATNALLPIDLTKKLPSIETPTTSVSLDSEGSTGSNKEPSTDTPAEAPTTSDDGSESSKAGSPPETPTKPDDGSESNKAGSPPETPTTPDADSATDASTKTKPATNALLPIDLTKKLPSIETPTTSVSLDSEDSTGSNKEPSTDTPAEAPTTSDDGSESSKAGSPPETPTTPDADSATDASTKTKPATNALLPIDLTKKLPSIETPTTSVSLDSEDSTGSNKEPSTDTPAEAPTTSDDGSESSKAGSPPETPTKPDDGSESNKAGSPPETPTTPDADSATDALTKTKPPTNALLPIDLTKKLPSIETPTTSVSLDSEGSTGSNKEPSTDTLAEAPTTSDDGSESSKAGSPPETPTTPDADSATDASTKTKPATNALLPIDLTKKLPSIETPTTSVSLDSEDSTGSNKEPSTDTPAEAPTTSDDGSESSKAGSPPETPTKPDDGSESNKAGSPPETPTTPDADSATDASTKTKPATNALLPIDLTKKLPSIETPTTSVSLDSEGSTGSNKEPSTDTPAEAPTTSDDGSESNKAGSPPETPTTPDADSATDASTKTKSATNALLPIDLTKRLPSIETPTTSVSLESEDSTGSNKEPSTDTPAEAPTTSDDGSESNKAGSPPETPTTPDADSATDASTKTKPPTNALLPIDLTKKLPSIETPTTSVSLESEGSTGSNKEPSTDTPAEAPTTSDDGSESNKAGSPPETPTTPDADSATDASTKTKSATNALLPIDLTKKLPSIETPTTSVSLDSEDSTGSNKEPSTDTPAEAPTTSDDGSESNKAGSPPETPTTPDADSATDASTKTKPATNALLPIDLTKKLPSIETPTTSVSLESEDSTGSNEKPSTDTLAEAPTTSDDGSESNKAGSPPETPTTPDADSATDASTKTKSATNALLPIDLTKKLPSIETPTTSVSLDSEDSTGSNKEPSTDTPAEAPTTSDDGSESNKAGSPPETPTTPDADSATDASTKTKPATNALLPIDLTKRLPSIETPTTSVSLDSEDSTGSNKEPSTDTPAEAPTTSDDGSESSKAGSPPETPTKPDDGSESNKAGSPPETPTKPDDGSESSKAGSPPETPTTPDADSATDASTKTKPATNALLPIDLTKKLPSIETPTTSVSLESEGSTGSNKEPSTDTLAEAPTTSDDGSESSKAGTPPETPTKPDDGSESNKAGSPPETPTTPDADSATDASTKTKSATNALLPIDLTKKLPSIETPTTSVSLDSEDSTGSNKEPSTDTLAEAPTTSDDGSESSKAGTPPETPTKPDDGSESNKAGSPPETPTTPDADSATDASTKTKPPTNALLPIDLTKKLPSIETPTTSVSLESEDSTGSNKEPSTDTPAEAPTTSDDGSESNKAGSPPETPTTPDADSATDASTKTKSATNALLPIDLTKKLPSIETPTTSVSLDSEDSTGSNKEPSTDTLAEAPTTSDDGSESSKAGTPPETPSSADAGSEASVTTESSFLLRTSGSSDETPAHTPTLPLTQWSPPPVLRAPARVPKSHSELSVSDSSSSQTGSFNPPHSLQLSKTPESSPDSPEDVMGIPAPVTSDPRTSTRPTPTTASSTPTPNKPSPSVSSSSTSGASSSDSPDSPEPSTDTAPAAASRKPTALDDNTPSPAPVKRAPALKVDSAKTHDDGNDVSQTEQTSLEMSPSELNKPSPAPVTRSPPSKAIMMPPSKAISMPPSKAISMPPSKAISMPPSKAISMPPSKAISMPPSLGSSDSMGTVMPADISDITDSAAEKVEKVKEVEEAEAITKQIDSGGRNEADENMIKDNDMILLGDTGSMITYLDGNKVTTFEKYNRGVDDLQTIRDEDDSYNNIIVGGGNRSNLPPGASISLSSASQKMQNTLLYTSYTLGAVSTVLLMFFHLLALHRPPWLGGSGDQGGGNGRTSMGWLTPNVWELIVVVGYIQHISSISMLELTKAPQIVLDFTDSFSFANLHLSSVTTTAVSKGSRRLQLVILTGIVAFSDRIGVDENEVLLTMFWFLLVAIAILGVLFASAAGFTFYRQHLSASTWSAFSAALRSSFAMCVVGLGVAAWVLSVFPLVVMSSYELVMQLRYRVGIGLAVALFSLWAVVAGGLSYAFVSVRAIPLKDAFRFKHFAVWGSLYGDSKMVFRYFFVVTVSFQILLGVITGAVSGMPAQLVALMVTHLLFVVIALIIRPFADRWVLSVVVSLRVIAIANLLCSFAFLTSSSLSLHWRGIVAQSFVVFNAITLILFFARYIAMFVLALKRWSSFTSRESVERYEMTQRLARSYNDRTPIFVTHDLRNHHQLHDGGRFIASGAGFTPTTRGPEYSSRYSSDYSDRHVYSSRQRYAPTPLGSSYSPDSRVHEQSHYH